MCRVYTETPANIINIISNAARIPIDCAFVIESFLGEVSWSEDLGKVTPTDITSLQKEEELIQLCNKVPAWNSQIQAYTLEFSGRAEVPSVHNFQLHNEQGNIVLQLGKVNDYEYNMDYSHPLTSFQAFAVCISVMDRSLVWD